MPELNINLKKEWAHDLYIRGELTQKAIAEKVDVSEQALSRWVNENNAQWEKEKTTLLTTKNTELNSLYRQLALLNQHNENALTDDDPETHPDYDRLAKLVKSIKSLEVKTGIGEMIETAKALISFTMPENIEDAKTINKWFDLFIKDRLQKMNM